jgi:hypothetical protein
MREWDAELYVKNLTDNDLVELGDLKLKDGDITTLSAIRGEQQKRKLKKPEQKKPAVNKENIYVVPDNPKPLMTVKNEKGETIFDVIG